VDVGKVGWALVVWGRLCSAECTLMKFEVRKGKKNDKTTKSYYEQILAEDAGEES
jgi:hypothetical protein